MINNDDVISIAIDDFATKKRYKYGTVIIDSIKRKIINIINSRESEDVTNELKKYKNVEYASRDGSWTYNKAIKDFNPSVKQVSDRFHILKNLTEKCCDITSSIIKGRISVNPKEKTISALAEYLLLDRHDRILLVKEKHNKGLNYVEIASMYNIGIATVRDYVEMKNSEIPDHSSQVRGREHTKAIENRMKKARIVKELYDNGKTINEIKKITNYSKTCITKYIKPDFDPCNAHYGQKKEGILPTYKDEIFKLYLSGKSSVEIAKYLKTEKGHKVTPDAVRGFILKEKRINKDLNISLLCSDVIDVKTIKNLYFFDNENEKIIPQFQLDEIIEKYPIIGDLLKINSSFKNIMLGKNSSKLNEWISDVKKFNIEPINSYLETLNKEKDAVINAIDMKNNNGIAEGKVNLIKLIKRVMFGRCNFETLQKKILLHEYQFEIV